MKPTPRDYLTIAAALLAIMLCGSGIGFLVGEHTTQQRLGSQAADDPQARRDWESSTLERLTTELGLTADQQAAIRGEIRTASAEVAAARSRALRDYQHSLLALHDRLLPHLTDSQRRRVEADRKQLQEMLDKGGTKIDADPE